ncbi:MAG: hypothetical protein OXC96_00290 [Cyanobacteria bacterium MAG CAR1_bin_15]|nr:hypothetical protein [Cyanobacteria bacterium MAG CAR1_bin_15]
MKRLLSLTAGLLLSLNGFPAFADEDTVKAAMVRRAIDSCVEKGHDDLRAISFCAGEDYGTEKTLNIKSCAERAKHLFQEDVELGYGKCLVLWDEFSATNYSQLAVPPESMTEIMKLFPPRFRFDQEISHGFFVFSSKKLIPLNSDS